MEFYILPQMAFSMYQFTRGEGDLKTTQDLFTQAEFFAEEANKFYKVVRVFTYQVRSLPLALESLVGASPECGST